MVGSRSLIGLLIALVSLQGCGNKGVVTSPFSQMAPLHTNPANASLAPRYSNRLVVKYRSGATDSQIRSFQQRFGLRTLRTVSALDIGVMGLADGANAVKTLASLQGNSAVEYAEPDFIFSAPTPQRTVRAASVRRVAAVSPLNDTDLDQQWGLKKIGMPQVWAMNGGSPSVIVAVVDTGVDVNHPDLKANLVPGYSVLSNASGPDDDHGHGTHVAGVIAAAANNGIGIAGMAPHCRIMPVKVLGRDGKGDTGDIVTGLIWAANNGAKVVNMSLGGTGGSRALKAAIDYALSKDVVLVAAMGNDGKNSQEYPAGYPGVIAVGATDSQDEITDFSNYGSWISVCAPGADIFSTLPSHSVFVSQTEGKDLNYDLMDGTSMASPFVAGLAALVRSQFPALSASAVKARIERGADDLGDPGFDEHFGHGRINAARTLSGR